MIKGVAMNTQYDFQFIGIVISIIGNFITTLSVIIAASVYSYQKKRQSKELACNLAKYYADEIIIQIRDCLKILKDCDIDFRSKIPMESIIRFDRTELDDILSKSNSSYKKTEHLVNSKFKRHPLGTDGCCEYIYNLLNDIESFAMNFNIKAADSNIVYQSLHQSYIATIWMLYYFIALKNTSIEDAYFTHTILLYERWIKEQRKTRKKAEKIQQKRHKEEGKLTHRAKTL